MIGLLLYGVIVDIHLVHPHNSVLATTFLILIFTFWEKIEWVPH